MRDEPVFDSGSNGFSWPPVTHAQIYTHMYFFYIVYGAISHDFILMVTQLTHTPYIWNTPYIHTTHTPNIHHTYTHMHHTHTHIPLACTHNTTHHTHIITYICTTCTHHIHTLPHTHKYMQNQNLTHTTTSIYTRFCEEGKASKMKRDRSGKKSRRVTKHKLPVTTEDQLVNCQQWNAQEVSV